MAAQKKFKCSNCGSMTDAILATVVSGKKYCPHCSAIRLKEVKAHNKIKQLINEHCGADYIPRFNSEIKFLLEDEDNNWTPSGVAFTLDYIFNVLMKDKEINYSPQQGIRWLIEKYYPEAKKFATERKNIQDVLSDENLKEVLNQEVVEVQVKRSEVNKLEEQFYEKRKDIIYGPKIDLDDLED